MALIERSRFWMVYGMNQGAPTFPHSSKTAAAAEAKRLAQRNPGIEFFVLEAVDGFRASQPVERIRVTEPIPF